MLRLIAKNDEPIKTPDESAAQDPFAVQEQIEREPLTALIACGDRKAQKWARRWLEQVGLEVRLATNATEAQEILPTVDPSIAILDRVIWERWGKHLYSSEAFDSRTADRCPVIVLCANNREAKRALSAGATDVARRPYDWQLIGRRASMLAQSIRTTAELERARDAIDQALDAANNARQQLEQRADRDPLTDLPNRRVFGQLLDRALAAPRLAGSGTAVLLLDLDRFGSINETVGRDGGNALLALIAGRLKQCLHGSSLLSGRAGLVSATVSRLDSDEFAFMISNVAGAEHISAIGHSILEALAEPFEIDGETTIHVAGSIGVARYPADGHDHESLIRRAELAMLESKDQGGAAVSFYQTELNQKACRRVTLDRELRLALERDEFILHYQPLIDTDTHEIVAVEALLRWQHPTEGLVAPMDFVPEAEETGLMVQIGSWVLHQACQQQRTWLDAGMPPIRMAINVSLCQLSRGDLLADIRKALVENDLDPSLLELELSERGVLGRTEEIVSLLEDLKLLGVRISVDDFGTGDSAIAYLKSLPIDVLKIDHSFVIGAPTSNDDAVIASAVVAMAHQLNLRVVAEGIESRQHVRLAEDWGCDEIQGYLFSPPRPAGDFATNNEGGAWALPQTDVESKV